MENQDQSKNLGSFFVNVNTKKGMFTPVRRSHRNKPRVEARVDDSNKENENPSNTRRDDGPAVSVDDLCSMFQTTMTVNNDTLGSDEETVCVTPIPDKGRYVYASLTEANNGRVHAVRRSTRRKSVSK